MWHILHGACPGTRQACEQLRHGFQSRGVASTHKHDMRYIGGAQGNSMLLVGTAAVAIFRMLLARPALEAPGDQETQLHHNVSEQVRWAASAHRTPIIPDPAPQDSCMQPGRGDAVQVVAPFWRQHNTAAAGWLFRWHAHLKSPGEEGAGCRAGQLACRLIQGFM